MTKRKVFGLMTGIAGALSLAGGAQAASQVQDMLGKPAPAFTLPSDRGSDIALADFHGKQLVVLAFFPKAFTPG